MSIEFFGCPIPKTGDSYEDARAAVILMIAEIQKRHALELEPYIKRLADIESCRPTTYRIAAELVEIVQAVTPPQNLSDQG